MFIKFKEHLQSCIKTIYSNYWIYFKQLLHYWMKTIIRICLFTSVSTIQLYLYRAYKSLHKHLKHIKCSEVMCSHIKSDSVSPRQTWNSDHIGQTSNAWKHNLSCVVWHTSGQLVLSLQPCMYFLFLKWWEKKKWLLCGLHLPAPEDKRMLTTWTRNAINECQKKKIPLSAKLRWFKIEKRFTHLWESILVEIWLAVCLR